jgi:ABC-2 type transport system permease protein
MESESLIKNARRDIQLIKLLVDRQLTVRYKRSVIGVGWTLLNPIITSFILWLVFSNNFGQKMESGQQYAPYLMAGTLLNTFFSQGVMLSATSIVNNAAILTKIYVKPQLFAIAAAVSGLVTFVIGLIPLVIVCLISGQAISHNIFLVLPVAVFLVLTVAGCGLGLSIIFIRYSDTVNVVTILLTILAYLTPLFYPISSLSIKMQKIVTMNPLTSFLDCFRWAFSNNASATSGDWLYIVTTGLISLTLGSLFFKKNWVRVVAML